MRNSKFVEVGLVTTLILLIAAWWNGYLSFKHLLAVGLVLGIVMWLVGYLFSEDEEESGELMESRERERKEEEAQERDEEAKEHKRRQRELEQMGHEKQKLALRNEIASLAHPPTKRGPDEEKFYNYTSKRVLDAKQKAFEKVFMPAMTARELEKALAEQKVEIDRDPALTEALKDRLRKSLQRNYRDAKAELKRKGSSIYDED